MTVQEVDRRHGSHETRIVPGMDKHRSRPLGEVTWLRLPAVTSSLGELTRFAREGASRASLPEAQIHNLDLVLEELLMNVFRYAYEPGEVGYVAVGYDFASPGSLEVQVSDSGRPFNPFHAEKPDVNLPLGERSVGGLGVHLIKHMAESFSYKRENGSNVVSFRVG